jgi:hypothetical protein
MAAAEEVPAPVEMLQMLAGFQIPQALYVVAEFGVSRALADGPRTVGPTRVALTTEGGR